MSGSGAADGEDVAVGVGVVVQHGQDGGLAGAHPERVRFGRGRAVGFGAVREHGLLDFVGGVLVRVVGGLLRRDDVVPVVDQLHVLVHQPHIPGIHVVQDHQVPVHPEHIRRRRTRLRHIHRSCHRHHSTQSRTYLFAPDHAACTHPPSCTGAAGTPCPPNVTVFAVEPSNGCISNAFGVATATASAAGPEMLQLRVPRLRQRQLTPARQEQLPPARIQHHRPIPHHRQLQIPRTLQPIPGARTRRSVTAPSRIHRRHRHLPRLRIRTVNPVISTHRRHRPRRPRQHRLGILRIKTAHRRRRQRPHRAPSPRPSPQ